MLRVSKLLLADINLPLNNSGNMSWWLLPDGSILDAVKSHVRSAWEALHPGEENLTGTQDLDATQEAYANGWVRMSKGQRHLHVDCTKFGQPELERIQRFIMAHSNLKGSSLILDVGEPYPTYYSMPIDTFVSLNLVKDLREFELAEV